MKTLVLQIRDASLRAVDATGLRAESPSCAAASGAALHVGDAALAIARHNPRGTVTRFWERIDQTPLPTPVGPARSAADLAYFHLVDVWRPLADDFDEVLLALPASLDRAARALAVGILRSASIPLAGVVESAVAAAASVDDERPRRCVDLGLHRVTATRVASEDGELVTGESEILVHEGLADLREAWVRWIAERFVQETRFDPLREAATEQRLYDQLPAWIEGAAGADTLRVELAVGDRRYAVEVASRSFADVAAAFYTQVDKSLSAADCVLLDDSLARLPGAARALRGQSLPPEAVGRSALAHVERIRSEPEAPAFVTRLPSARGGARPATASASAADEATHVLHAARAYRCDGAPLLLGGASPRALDVGEVAQGALLRGRRLEIPEGLEVRVNGQPVDGDCDLALGDRIELAAQRYEMIRV